MSRLTPSLFKTCLNMATTVGDIIKAKSIHFAEWIDLFCTRGIGGYFIADDEGLKNGLHTYSIEELYDIYLAQCEEYKRSIN